MNREILFRAKHIHTIPGKSKRIKRSLSGCGNGKNDGKKKET